MKTQEFTINQYLDKLISKYGSYNKMDKEVRLLYDKLIEAKYKFGGRQVINPEGECKELINKYL